MSHDELPPPAEPSETGEKAAETAREASSTEAPPAVGRGRRRPRAAGTAESPAASEQESAARAPRRRRKAAATAAASDVTPPVEASLGEASGANAPEVAAPQQAPEQAPARRTRRRAAPSPSAVETPPVVETAPAPDAPVVEGVGPAIEAPSVALPPIPAAEGAAGPVEVAAAPAAAPVEAPARATRRRGRKAAAPAPESAALEQAVAAPAEAAPQPSPSLLNVEQAIPAPAEAEEQAGAAAPAEAVPVKPERRRGGRRRAAALPPVEAPAPEAVAAPEAAVEPDAASLPAPSAEIPTAVPSEAVSVTPEVIEPPTRARRGRRERAAHRGATRVTPVEEAAATVEAIPAPEPVVIEEKVDRTVGGHLVWRHGMPEIYIHGVAYPPVLFFGNMEGTRNRQRVLSEVRRAARAGVHLHSTLVELTCPLAEHSEALDEIDELLRAILEADPQGYIMPRVVFVPARGWKREYPTEIATYADGTTGDPSITSERFWQEAEHSLVTLIEHLRLTEWGRHIFGYHLERGEWFQPADQGYDRSMANRDAFRDWLREKYKNNLVALRAAWYDGDVQFHTAEIPPLIAKPNPNLAFYEPRRQRRYIDFNEFTAESTARRLIQLARVIKKATSNQAIVSVCYGYTLEFGHPYSGHLALGMLLSTQAINLICGPPSYRDRKPGGAASLPAPVDSLPLHGKLWLSEDDTKTYLAPAQQEPGDFNPRLGDRFLTEQAQARTMGHALTHLTGVDWMDLWGEGWLDDEAIWERLGAFTARYAAFLKQHERPQAPEVIALIDEKSLLHVQRGEAFFRKLTNGLRDSLQRAGISYGTYLQSDLLARDFPTGAKLYLFLTPYRLTSEQRAAIKEKLQRDGKTLSWLYAPGTCDEHPSMSGMMEETAHGAIGITLRQQEWNSEVGSRVIEPYHPITERLPSREYGTRERLNPSFYVDDSGAKTLAEYQGSGLPSLAVRDFGTWKSVFVGDPVLPLELLRGICRYAGVHLWLAHGDDVVMVGNGWGMIHATKDGHRTLRLPTCTGLYDVVERRLVADEVCEYRYFQRAGTTRLFCVGTAEHFLRLGLPNVTLPGPGRARIVLDRSQEKETTRRETGREAGRETGPTVPGPLRADLETLEAVLSLDLQVLEASEVEDLDGLDTIAEEALPEAESLEITASEAAAGGEVVANGRRRRRRGGRGRWRKRTGSLSEGAEEAASPEAAEPPPAEPPAYEGGSEAGE